jgi:site-specific recombinase XerD
MTVGMFAYERRERISMSDDYAPLALSGELTEVGQAANAAARRGVFAHYRRARTATTLAAQDADLHRFATFLAEVGVQTAFHDRMGRILPTRFAGLTFGLVAAFVAWQGQQGYAIASINRALATVKVYARLAMQATIITETEYRLIKSVEGYSHREGRNLDAKRPVTRRDRPNAKKALPTSITEEQAVLLKTQHPDTPQGIRDRLIFCLLLDHGLRVSELVDLLVSSLRLESGEIHFYRRKVDRWQTHRLSEDALAVARQYLALEGVRGGDKLLRGSYKNGELNLREAMSTQAVNRRVQRAGERYGMMRLSPHDCRHYWATQAAQGGTDLVALQEAGGWASPMMPLRYIEVAKVANERVQLGKKPTSARE